ncbi:hypothetical protein [Mobiluncus sp.]|uniref:hypothetical protein n=1 Tax=Mobiluncus sp. TaxID=47293 RepID=UPI002A91256A|nr:hypothetical protein [Mobiluncus sp.]MDY6076057.1 hypothetical protein [Mobiluncus sp.]
MSDPMPPASIRSESSPTPPPRPEADAVAKSRNVPLIGIIVALALLVVAGIILLVALLGKGSAGGEEAAGTSSAAGKTATVQKHSHAQKLQTAFAQYTEILDAPTKYLTALERDNSSGAYKYALTEMNGDGIPELLFGADDGYGLLNVQVFSADGSGNPFIAPSKVLLDGVALGGGTRAFIMGSKAGNGIIQVLGSASNPQWYCNRMVLQGSELVESDNCDFTFGESTPVLDGDGAELQWLDVSDRSALQKLAGPAGAAGAKQPAGGKSADQKAKAIAAARAQGKQVLEGTLRIMGHKEVLQMQGMPEPNPVPPGTDFSHERYVVVLLDQKQGVLGILGDGSGETDTIETDILDLYSYTGIGNEEDRSSQWQKYDGRRVVVAADTDDICWPSGVGVPIGAPAFGGDVIFAE